MIRKLSSNQYKSKHDFISHGARRTVFLIAFLTTFLLLGILTVDKKLNDLRMSQKIISPLAQSPAVMGATFKVPELAGLPERQKAIAIIKKIWGKDQNIGLALARCESGYKTTAISSTADFGLFQISHIHSLDKDDLFNPVANTLVAYKMWQEQGLTPWFSSRNCWSNLI